MGKYLVSTLDRKQFLTREHELTPLLFAAGWFSSKSLAEEYLESAKVTVNEPLKIVYRRR